MSKNLRLHTLPKTVPYDIPWTIVELEETLLIGSHIVTGHREIYAPTFERIERELEMARKYHSELAARAAGSPPAQSRSVSRSAGGIEVVRP
jgi:hypothetical protein